MPPINSLMALFPNHRSSLSVRQEHKYNLWCPVQNEYVQPVVQKVLRISKRQVRSEHPEVSASQPVSGGGSLIRPGGPLDPGSCTSFQNCPLLACHRRLVTPTSLVATRTFFSFCKSQARMLLFNVCLIFLWGWERYVFAWPWMAGRPGGLTMGPSRIEEGGREGLHFLSSPPWHTLPVCVFISSYPQYIGGKGDETGGRFNCQAAGSLSRGSCCHAAILKWPCLFGLLFPGASERNHWMVNRWESRGRGCCLQTAQRGCFEKSQGGWISRTRFLLWAAVCVKGSLRA